LAALSVLVALFAGACQATTAVSVVDNPNGSGTLTVSVTLDRAANTAVGGLATQFDGAGLAEEGWVVGPVTPTAAGGASVLARHPFSTPAQLSAAVATIAGSGDDRLFTMSVAHDHGVWQDHTVLTGRVDLSCGVDCFGDAALARASGSPVGFDASTAATEAGVAPAEALRFSVAVRLPGQVTATNAGRRGGALLRWQPQLGHVVVLDATTQSWNTAPIVVAGIAAGVLLLLLVAGLVLTWRRFRRRRHGPGTAPGQGVLQVVAPVP
jgi:hypothetical protein